jgi:tetratricopeptide (TPR) repeat protein
MSFWSRLTGGQSGPPKPQKLDYLSEGLALERQGDYDAAITSYRLALRDQPSNHKVLQNMAIAYTKMGQIEQAVRCYRGALQIQPKLSGAHYGLAFLLLRQGDMNNAAFHLEAFLMDPPKSEEAERWIKHARAALEALQTVDGDTSDIASIDTSSGMLQDPSSGGE